MRVCIYTILRTVEALSIYRAVPAGALGGLEVVGRYVLPAFSIHTISCHTRPRWQRKYMINQRVQISSPSPLPLPSSHPSLSLSLSFPNTIRFALDTRLGVFTPSTPFISINEREKGWREEGKGWRGEAGEERSGGEGGKEWGEREREEGGSVPPATQP